MSKPKKPPKVTLPVDVEPDEHLAALKAALAAEEAIFRTEGLIVTKPNAFGAINPLLCGACGACGNPKSGVCAVCGN